MIKPLRKLGIEGKYLSLIKETYPKKSIAIITLNAERMKPFTLTSETRQVCPLSPILFYWTRSSSQSNQAKEQIKVLQIGEEELKLFLLADDMIQYKENSNNPQEILL